MNRLVQKDTLEATAWSATHTRLSPRMDSLSPYLQMLQFFLMFQYSVTFFWFCFLFLFRLQTWVLAQRTDEQTSIHDRWFGWSIRASDSSFRSSTCYNDINAVVIDGKESFADLKNPHPPRLRGPGVGRGTQSFIRGDPSPKVQTFTPLYLSNRKRFPCLHSQI